MVPEATLNRIRSRLEVLEKNLSQCRDSSELVELSREYSGLKPIVEKIDEYFGLVSEAAQLEEILGDSDLKELAAEELRELKPRITEAEQDIRVALLPKDANDSRPAILEVRAGTGGEEAALFSGDLVRMYERFAQLEGWKFEILSSNATMLGGFREATAEVKGSGAYAKLKFESGVHRVQRVPATETSGRIHTSAATVAVLPEAQEVDIEIAPSDLRIETMRASGAGGQHVNKTDSAVRITHLPTGISVMSSEKSQHHNRAVAMKVIRTRLFEEKRRKADAERAADRKSQVGSGDRSERVRTYNFPQGRITDHRINLTLYKLEHVLAGNLYELIDALVANDRARRLLEIDN
ncbi:MAG: peptide chain release factor 1 [Albidovulum sp.]|nr:peptide chain release factor 1 [Albidovulum sp.]